MEIVRSGLTAEKPWRASFEGTHALIAPRGRPAARRSFLPGSPRRLQSSPSAGPAPRRVPGGQEAAGRRGGPAGGRPRPGAEPERGSSSAQSGSPTRPHRARAPPAPRTPGLHRQPRSFLQGLPARRRDRLPASPATGADPGVPGLERFRRAGRRGVSRVAGEERFSGWAGGAIIGVAGPTKGAFSTVLHSALEQCRYY